MRRMRILIVEDDPGIRFALEASLDLDGHDVVAVDRGEHALELLEGGASVDLILLDLNTNGISAQAFLTRLAPSRPVVCVLSASVGADLEAARIRADFHVRKPFDHSDLARILERVGARRDLLTQSVTSASVPA
jgi:CheY-like chemotaxis protein